jgi:hypothetical protein
MASTDGPTPDPFLETRKLIAGGNWDRTWPHGADAEFRTRVAFVAHMTQQAPEACAAAVAYIDPDLRWSCSAAVRASVPTTSPLPPASSQWHNCVSAATSARHGSARGNSGYASWRREHLAAATSTAPAPFVAG